MPSDGMESSNINPENEHDSSSGWLIAAIVLYFMGLAVIPSTTEPGWGGSLFFWSLATAALANYVLTIIRRRKR